MTARAMVLRTSFVWLCAAFFCAAFAATTPSSGTISPASPTLSFTGGPFAASNPLDQTGSQPPACAQDITCSQFVMTVSIPATDFNSYRARVTLSWTNSGTTTLGNDSSDYDMYIYTPDVTGSQRAKAASSANPEVATFDVANGA